MEVLTSFVTKQHSTECVEHQPTIYEPVRLVELQKTMFVCLFFSAFKTNLWLMSEKETGGYNRVKI